MSEGGLGPTRSESDIYTVLLAIAALFLLVAIVFVSIRSQQFFDQWLPLGGV